jgi:hypothetical protein
VPFVALVRNSLAIVFDAYNALQQVKDQAPSYPYRYSFLQEELRELERGKLGRLFGLCRRRARASPQLIFFLSTEDMLHVLEDPETVSASWRPQRKVVTQEQDVALFHHIQATHQMETVITYDDMVYEFGWGDIQARWLLSQLGVPDDRALEQSKTDMQTAERKAVEAAVRRQITAGLQPVRKDLAVLQAQFNKLLQQVATKADPPQ